MKGIVAVFVLTALVITGVPAFATQNAIIPAYAYVSQFHSSMKEYKQLIDRQNRAAARKLLKTEKVFLSPKDVKVEVVTFDENIVKVKLSRLNEKAEPVTLYFWTLADQIKLLP